MKKMILFLILAASANYSLQAIGDAEQLTPVLISSPQHHMQPTIRRTQVTETQDFVAVNFTTPHNRKITNDVRLEFRRSNVGVALNAWVWQQRSDGSGLEDAFSSDVVPMLPCPVVVERAKLGVISPTEFQVIFPKGTSDSDPILSGMHEYAKMAQAGQLSFNHARIEESGDSVIVRLALPIGPLALNYSAPISLRVFNVDGFLAAYMWQQNIGVRFDLIPMPPLPCPVVVERAQLKLNSSAELVVTLSKAQASAKEIPESSLSKAIPESPRS